MTLSKNSDNDNMAKYQLTPAEQYIYKWSKARPDQPFCFLDFIEKYAHGTIRNAFSRLQRLGLVRTYCRSFAAFYVHLFSKLKAPHKPMTITHTVGNTGIRRIQIDLRALLDSLDWEDVCRVHDVVLSFSAHGIYDYYSKENPDKPNKVSMDIRFGSFDWSVGRILTVVLHHNGKITSYLGCSNCPIEVSIGGLVSLASFLGGVRTCIVEFARSVDPGLNEQIVPDVSDWIVVQWHYGRDGAQEISGPAFNVTFRTWFGELARIYMRHSGQFFKPRLEVVERPRKTLPQAFAEKIDPNYKGGL